MNIYLAARYSRRLELCEYRSHLVALGHFVPARWLNGGHQLGTDGTPIGENGESLVEDGSTNVSAAELRFKFAQDDYEDVTAADLIVSFTELPRSGHSRGGRHVEFGIGLGLGTPLIVVGYRENIFHWLPQVTFFDHWVPALEHITCLADRRHTEKLRVK